MKYLAVITGGGTGSRMGESIPKQFLPLNGVPVIMHTISHFHRITEKIFVCLPKEWIDHWKELQIKYNFTIPHILIEGGNTRFESVNHAVSHLPDEGLVAIHDAVRPFVTASFVLSCFKHAEIHGNAVAAVPLEDSLRMIAGTKTKAVDRKDFYAVQTPQIFPCEIIKKAYLQDFQPSFTDDAAVVEALGYAIHIVQGDKRNLKITTKEDLLFAEYVLKND